MTFGSVKFLDFIPQLYANSVRCFDDSPNVLKPYYRILHAILISLSRRLLYDIERWLDSTKYKM
jgi:hypothetical protein